MEISRRSVLSAAAAALAFSVTGCAHQLRSPQQGTPTAPVPSPVQPEPPVPAPLELRVGTAAPPRALEPSWADDAESHRVTRQIAETLLGVDPDTGAPTPQLATRWTVSPDGLRYTFTLRPDVLFHDGTELDSEVVAANFVRWSTLPSLLGNERIAALPLLSFPSVFGGWQGEEGCRLVEVEPRGRDTLLLVLSEPISFLLNALTAPSFAITSPSSWAPGDHRLAQTTGTSLPAVKVAGTGPYRWSEESVSSGSGPGEEGLQLEIWDKHWGDQPRMGPVILQVSPRAEDRLRDLRRDELDVFDVVTPDLLRPLVQGGAQILQRDPVSVLYLGMNLDHPVVGQLYVRQAVAHAVDRSALVNEHFLAGTSIAHHFVPPSLGVDPTELHTYGYDRSEAERLLDLSTYDGEPLEFLYPVYTARPYLPSPEQIYAHIAHDLGRVGIAVNPVPIPWDDDYTGRIRDHGSRAFHLGGRTAQFRDPHSFVHPLFGHDNPEFAYQNSRVIDWIESAARLTDQAERRELFSRAAVSVSLDLPALPLAFPISAVAVGPRIQSYPISPVLDERFDRVVPVPEQ